MGTVASLTVDAVSTERIDVAALQAVFDRFDDTYSLYKPQSELSRIAAGELALMNASPEMLETYANALGWREATHGDFSPHRPDGVIDLSGIVKALAMQAAGAALLRCGASDWCLNVGGDVLVSGSDRDSAAWSVGIVDPADRHTLLTSADLWEPRRACATSGSAERGDHIWTVGSGPTTFVQATVIADAIVTADVLATAIIAGGASALDQVCATWDVDVMTVDRDGNLRMTPGFGRSRSAATVR
jgi:thiamine biosynthesis lipoprotein